ncbi:helix-turn-helix domain-containing protein [Paracoccus aestuariivivens]|uniref:Helix-turn-helix domain-containing protein n=1 Tax=Paracoccus aestuariivivens TaxID=1820333 RepID=A0A6L6JCC7_9RHOB|nr:AraC family transcriptional regulator [Paracoccus aestuariivivens]MTH79146.1 helix-turn-helix domain-containing protein [Paracoccus aestuariivivens]
MIHHPSQLVQPSDIRVCSLRMRGMLVRRESYSGTDSVLCMPRIAENDLQITVYLRDCALVELWSGERLLQKGAVPSQSLTITDMARKWSMRQSCFDRMVIDLAWQRMREFAQDLGRGEFSGLQAAPATRDAAMFGLAQALLPALDNPRMAARLFLEQIELAILVHLGQSYGGLCFSTGRKGSLSATQEARATEALVARVDGDFSLAEIAAECGLSKGYFIKAFSASFGKTPYRWLLEYRVARAKDLLRTDMPISQIALDCGFADQSHLSRIFTALVGMPPGNWRREHAAARPIPGLLAEPATPFSR